MESFREEILSALERVSPDDRQVWLDVGMAIQSEAPGLEGFNLWRVWSEMNDAAGKFDASDLERVWGSFKRSGNPAGKPRGAVSGRSKALGALDRIIGRDENVEILEAAPIMGSATVHLMNGGVCTNAPALFKPRRGTHPRSQSTAHSAFIVGPCWTCQPCLDGRSPKS